MDKLLEANGVNGQITVYRSRIDITRKGFLGFACHGFDGTKSIFISKLTAVQFKEAGKVTNGFIQFVFAGSNESTKGLFDATKDENTIVFSSKDQEQFEQIRNIILDNQEKLAQLQYSN